LIRHQPRPRGTLMGLPNPYVVPAEGHIFQEMYYWDSYFTALGLVGIRHAQLIVDMTVNMASLYRRFGVIPNASRYYFLSRSQPPFFTRMVWLAFQVKSDRGDADALSFLESMMRLAEREHLSVWLGTHQPHDRQVYRGLSRYFDINFLDVLASCESGWDHSTRCDGRWLDHLPVDLNAILYVRETDLARAWELLGHPGRAVTWSERAAMRKETVNELLWDPDRKFYFDYDWKRRERNPDPSLAGFYPLWAGMASPEQAAAMVRVWLSEFEFPGGLITTKRQEAGKQWAFPNGWAPLQWIVTEGLDRYGFREDAARIRKQWCSMCIDVFERTGAMWEKYNVVTAGGAVEEGLYGSIKGFGWSNGVFVDFVSNARKPPRPGAPCGDVNAGPRGTLRWR
ncbi:MAG: trehalase family glycosidase, partial [Chloroflexota bacterium]